MNMLVVGNGLRTQFEFNSIDTLFKKYELSWNNVTGLCLDNPSSNIGSRNLIRQRAIEMKENIFVSSFLCHILRNNTSKANSEI